MQHTDTVKVDILLSISNFEGLLKGMRKKKSEKNPSCPGLHSIAYESLPKQIKETPGTGYKLYYSMSYAGAGICTK